MKGLVCIIAHNDPDIPLSQLSEALKSSGLSAELHFHEKENTAQWTVLDVYDRSEILLAEINRFSVSNEPEIAAALNAMKAKVQGGDPVLAAQWLAKYLNLATVAYAIQLEESVFDDSNFEIVQCIVTQLRKITSGILYSQGEGFTNQQGHFIFWDNPNDISGSFTCSVLNQENNWQSFDINFTSADQMASFLLGKIPARAIRHESMN